MMCSGRELLLADDHDGIIELAADAKVGEPAAAALGLTDPVIDVAITPNRGDCSQRLWHRARSGGGGPWHAEDADRSTPVAGKFPSPEERSRSNFTPETQIRLPAVRGPAGARREERPVAQMGAGPAEGRRPASDLGAGRRHQFDRARPRPAAARLRRRQAGRQHAGAPGQGRRASCWRSTARPTRWIREMCVIADEAAARGIAGVMGGEDTGCSERRP